MNQGCSKCKSNGFRALSPGASGPSVASGLPADARMLFSPVLLPLDSVGLTLDHLSLFSLLCTPWEVFFLPSFPTPECSEPLMGPQSHSGC